MEAGRLCLAQGKTGEAKEHFKKAAEMIEQTGYHRRDKEVEKWVSEIMTPFGQINACGGPPALHKV